MAQRVIDLTDLPDPCTVGQLAKWARISKNRVYEDIRAGRLHAKKFGIKTIRLRRTDIDRWFAASA